MNRFRLAACCSMNFLGGLNDSAIGASIDIETHYGISHDTASLIFVGVAVGFVLCSASLQNRLGLAKVFGLGELLCITGYIPIVATTLIPVIVSSSFIAGFGFATNLAILNVWLANHKEAATALGWVHGMYGVGGGWAGNWKLPPGTLPGIGIVGLLIATSMVSHDVLWSCFYLVAMGIAAFNMVFATVTFWKDEQETDAPQIITEASPIGARQLSAMLLTSKTRVVLVGAQLIFAYQGAEVSISGWVISLLIASRNGEPSQVGYVTSDSWAGITLGRFLLSPLGPYVGEKRFVYGLVIGSAIFELLVWLVPNVVGDAVAVAIAGLLLDPVYPNAAVVFTKNLSRKQQASGLAVISAFGSS